jgi:formamidopyrimidine-DNA glycosylase
MPELPEVETTRRGLEALIVGKSIGALTVREPRLRWPVSPDLPARLIGQRVAGVRRRGKYLLIDLPGGSLLVHLGMSGSLRYLSRPEPPRAHDHVDLALKPEGWLRFNDPRRFGSLHFALDPAYHPLLRNIGPEPLGDGFDGDYLAAACSRRRVSIKQHLMNGTIVAGVGNIYANEALFLASIHPGRKAGKISRHRLAALADAVKAVLGAAVEHGGTTLRDFVGSDGRPGYFKLSLNVYDRAGAPCKRCGAPIVKRQMGQRASYYCPRCQR